MVVNFKIYEINQDVCKLIRTSKLIIIKKVALFFFFIVLHDIDLKIHVN